MTIATGTAVGSAVPLAELDALIERAIADGDPGPLCVLGYGEVTLVIGWPTERPMYAVKRLPAFEDAAELDRYRALLDEYIVELGARGIAAVATEVGALRSASGELHGYLIQPLVPRERLLDHVLRDADASTGERLVQAVAGHVAAAVDGRVGLDAQAANWAVEGEDIVCFDVSTPMLYDAGDRPCLELRPFISLYPWALRPLLLRVARDVMRQYNDPRKVLLDFASNLVKEELERWLPAALAAASELVSPPITEDEVRRYFRRDRRFWLAMQRLRRADRAWQRHVRHRSYGFLLPPPYRYGPPWQSKGEPT